MMRACCPDSRLTRTTDTSANAAPRAKSGVSGSPRSTPTATGTAAPPIAVSGETMPIGPRARAAYRRSIPTGPKTALTRESRVPVLQAPPLARALYAHAEIDSEIPAALYTAVAQVLAYVYQLKAALRGQGAMPGDLPQPEVPRELDPHWKPAPTETAT